MNRPPIRSIAVFGGGAVALCAAIAFSRALRGVSVTLVSTPLDPAALADRLPATLPTIGQSEDFGIDEETLVACGAATHRVGQRFDDWGAKQPWFAGFGATGIPIAGAAFHQHWLADEQANRAPFHCFAPGAVLAQADRFLHPIDDARSPLSQFAYALRLDPQRAPRAMHEIALQSGIACEEGAIGAVERGSDGRVRVVRTASGSQIAADLFIDCTGPARLLAAGGDTFEDWSDTLPCDRLLLATTAIHAPSPIDRYTALPIGWRASWPMRDSAIAGLAYRAALTTEADARRAMRSDAAECIAFRPGRWLAPWQDNVLTLGDAAMVSDPLGATGLALAHAGIALALELLPGRDFHPLELAEYNRRTAHRHQRARDFLALHYAACARTTGPFWRAQRLRPMPDSLARSFEQFARRGTLPHYEEESFDKESWIAAMIGLGVVPRQRNPAALSAEPMSVARTMASIDRAMRALPARVPPYADYLTSMRSPK